MANIFARDVIENNVFFFRVAKKAEILVFRGLTCQVVLIGFEQISGVQRSARKSKKLLDSSSFFPVHQTLRRRRQVERRHDVRRVRQLGLHFLTGDGFHFVDDQLPLPLRSNVTPDGGGIHGCECKALLLVVQQGCLFAGLKKIDNLLPNAWPNKNNKC